MPKARYMNVSIVATGRSLLLAAPDEAVLRLVVWADLELLEDLAVPDAVPD